MIRISTPQAFLEMETHKEARDVVSYYQQNPAVLYGKQITCYLSKELMVIQVILECPYSSIFIRFACICCIDEILQITQMHFYLSWPLPTPFNSSSDHACRSVHRNIFLFLNTERQQNWKNQPGGETRQRASGSEPIAGSLLLQLAAWEWEEAGTPHHRAALRNRGETLVSNRWGKSPIILCI